MWLFPVGMATAFMAETGAAWVADHNARVSGQTVIRFPSRRKAPDAPEVTQ